MAVLRGGLFLRGARAVRKDDVRSGKPCWTEQWPLDPVTGFPLVHGFTLRLPEDYRPQGPEIVAYRSWPPQRTAMTAAPRPGAKRSRP